MLATLKRLLAPPSFEGDEDKTRISRLLNTILLAFLAMTLSMTATVFMMEFSLVGMLSLATLGLLAVGALALMRLGYIRVVSVLFTVGLLIFDTALVAG